MLRTVCKFNCLFARVKFDWYFTPIWMVLIQSYLDCFDVRWRWRIHFCFVGFAHWFLLDMLCLNRDMNFGLLLIGYMEMLMAWRNLSIVDISSGSERAIFWPDMVHYLAIFG